MCELKILKKRRLNYKNSSYIYLWISEIPIYRRTGKSTTISHHNARSAPPLSPPTPLRSALACPTSPPRPGQGGLCAAFNSHGIFNFFYEFYFWRSKLKIDCLLIFAAFSISPGFYLIATTFSHFPSSGTKSLRQNTLRYVQKLS